MAHYKKTNKNTVKAESHDDYRPSMMQPLETRLMFDASAADAATQGGGDAGGDQSAAQQAAAREAVEHNSAQTDKSSVAATRKEAEKLFGAEENESSTQSTIRELVIIDMRVEDYESLISNLSRDSKVYYIDGQQDGVLQLTNILREYQNLDALHIVTHGDSGLLELGSIILDIDNINQYQESLAVWRDALSSTADVLFYGCNVAEGERGEAFISQLSTVLAADIAASTDLTGSALLGGDWELEKQALESGGQVESRTIFDRDAQDNYGYVLGDPMLIIPNSFSITYNAETKTAVTLLPGVLIDPVELNQSVSTADFSWASGGQVGDYIQFVGNATYSFDSINGDILKNGVNRMGTISTSAGGISNRIDYTGPMSGLTITFADSEGVTGEDVNSILGLMKFGSTASNNSISINNRVIQLDIRDDDGDQSVANSTVAINVNLPVTDDVIITPTIVEPTPVFQTNFGLVDDPLNSQLITEESDPGIELVSTSTDPGVVLFTATPSAGEVGKAEQASQQLKSSLQNERAEERIDQDIQDDIRTADNMAPLTVTRGVEDDTLTEEGTLLSVDDDVVDQEQAEVLDATERAELNEIDKIHEKLSDQQIELMQDFSPESQAAIRDFESALKDKQSKKATPDTTPPKKP